MQYFSYLFVLYNEELHHVKTFIGFSFGSIGMQLTESLENYLKIILILNRRLGMVRAKNVADELGFSKPSVSHAVSILKKGGFLDMGSGNSLVLTKKGRQCAEAVLRRYTVIAGFLSNTLGVDTRTAGKDACRLEHAFSEQSFSRLKGLTVLSPLTANKINFLMKGENIYG
jgi:Mn-dependent DtxR family transcriptional regulator